MKTSDKAHLQMALGKIFDAILGDFLCSLKAMFSMCPLVSFFPLPQVIWQILGPNSNEVLPSVNTDIGEPVNGTFSFRDGEGGVRSIELKILPHGEVEVTEKFIVMLSILSGEMGVDPKAGSVTLTVRPRPAQHREWWHLKCKG